VTAVSQNERVAWVDYGKGICIFLVVMLHSTYGVQNEVGSTGYLEYVVAFARPFRMPDFFLLSGLFLSVVIARPWRDYLDRKVVHFAYFYVLWLTIQFAFKGPMIVAETGRSNIAWSYVWSFIQPFGTLWFIYMLPVFFVLTKVLVQARVPVVVVWCVAAGLEMAHIETGWDVVDEFCMRFVYFYSGYIFAPIVFRFAAWVGANPLRALVGLVAWAVAEAMLVLPRWDTLAGISLVMGYAGALAVVSTAALMQKVRWFGFIRYWGRNSLAIYLGFFLPMVLARSFIIGHPFLVPDVGTACLAVTVCGVVGAILMFWTARLLRIRFLYERPRWARLVRPALAGPEAAVAIPAPSPTTQ
jgi:uncharacterized membrane protein YcfT